MNQSQPLHLSTTTRFSPGKQMIDDRTANWEVIQFDRKGDCALFYAVPV